MGKIIKISKNNTKIDKFNNSYYITIDKFQCKYYNKYNGGNKLISR